ncbi:3-deoxy-D-manno-octulosonic acid transferase [Boseongicola aestuarii]|uniref:3-deoxy-D-manno-octulosonic acid transferase n=1 Tax=Boseongicola aestuarii TaxID=1470561 RepID=A0A238J0J4_9RHOB|nr:glycosyltransferase N-terminal domain-containing protein [Boseongicola aestuarii]SMX23831.1 3-deoxy-D-manno-octulosonic acid transferase [Boseongicola aestuarii]
MGTRKADHWQLRAYLAARVVLQPSMPWILRRRLRQGKEEPERVGEKFGKSSITRPDGQLVWIHAVGLGELLALRPLIRAMHSEDPKLNFLITSTARSSARVIDSNLPPRTIHQFLPLDGPSFVRRFLNHWRPDLSIWSEQDLWPGAIHDADARGTPLAFVNARMSSEAKARRARLKGLYRAIFDRFALISAQDEGSAAAIAALGGTVNAPNCNLKPAAQPLAVDEQALKSFRALLSGRAVWVAASTHADDEDVVLHAQTLLLAKDPTALLILVPRSPDRAADIVAAIEAAGLSYATRSADEFPEADTQVYLADSFGELGIWYRLARSAFVGGSFGGLGGHNPWEAICLGVTVHVGPDTQNFRTDYDTLTGKGLCHRLTPGDAVSNELADAVFNDGDAARIQLAQDAVEEARAALTPLARDLVAMVGSPTRSSPPSNSSTDVSG